MGKELLKRLQEQTRARLEELQTRAEDPNVTAEDLQNLQDEVDQETKNMKDISDQIAALAEGDDGNNGDDGSDDGSDAGNDDSGSDAGDGSGSDSGNGDNSGDGSKRGVQHVTPAQRNNVLDAIRRGKNAGHNAIVVRDAADSDEAIRSAFANAVLGRADAKQLRSLGVANGKGSVTIPKVVAKDIITYTEEENLLRKYGTVVQSTDTQGYPILVKKATANSHKKERADDDPTPESDVEFDEVVLAPAEFDAIATVSQKLITMSGVNVPQAVTDELTKAYAHRESGYMFTGDAVKDEDKNSGSLSNKATAFIGDAVDLTATGWAQILYANIVKLKNMVPTSLLKTSMWIVNRPALTLLESMTDTTGRPLLHEAKDGIGYTLLGYPLDFTDNAEGSTDDAPVFYFGSMKSFYIQDVLGSMAVQPLYELYATTNRVGFKIYNIVDGQLVFSPLEIPVYKYELTAPKA